MAGLTKVFGDWPQGDAPAFAPIDPPQPVKRVIVIDRPDAVQTEIRIGQLGIPRRHADYLAMDQAVKILGGEGANRLQQVLRSQRGLTYGASADLETYKTAGGIVAETDTRTDATAEVLRLAVDEFYKLQRERVYDGELEGAQAYLAGHFPLTIETPDAIATQVLNQLFYELPLEELQTYPERVRSVSPDDVQRVARNYLRPDRLAVVLVGNADAFVKDLKGVGFGEYERIPIAAGRSARRRSQARQVSSESVAIALDDRRMRVMLSCGEASGDLYAGALVDALRQRDPHDRRVRPWRRSVQGRRRPPDRRLPRAHRHRPHRSGSRAARFVRDVSPARAGGRRRAARRARPHRLSRTSTSG